VRGVEAMLMSISGAKTGIGVDAAFSSSEGGERIVCSIGEEEAAGGVPAGSTFPLMR